jgi:thioredoxin 1
MIHRVSDRTFARDVLSSVEPVLVNFVEGECGPCKTISPVLEQLAREMEGRVKVVTMDVGENWATRTEYNVHGLPTLIVFVNGETAARRIGAVVETADLEAWVNDVLVQSSSA